MKILVADDEPLTNQIVSETLRKWGYDVTSVDDGNSAWKVLQKESGPKLAILDWMMPGLSGVDICQKLRVQKSHSYVYVILLTGKSDKVDVIEGLSSGADDYLTKPCNPHELRVRLNVGERVLRMEKELLDALDNIKLLTSLNQQNHKGASEISALNSRELEILNMIQENKSDEEIAQSFRLSPKWVEAHLHNILLKLNVPDRQMAAERALKSGLIGLKN